VTGVTPKCKAIGSDSALEEAETLLSEALVGSETTDLACTKMSKDRW